MVDVCCSLPFATVYTATLPVIAAGLLNNQILPFREALGLDALPGVPTTTNAEPMEAATLAPAAWPRQGSGVGTLLNSYSHVIVGTR